MKTSIKHKRRRARPLRPSHIAQAILVRSLIDGKASVASMAEQSGLSLETVRRTLRALLAVGAADDDGIGEDSRGRRGVKLFKIRGVQ